MKELILAFALIQECPGIVYRSYCGNGKNTDLRFLLHIRTKLGYRTVQVNTSATLPSLLPHQVDRRYLGLASGTLEPRGGHENPEHVEKLHWA